MTQQHINTWNLLVNVLFYTYATCGTLLLILPYFTGNFSLSHVPFAALTYASWQVKTHLPATPADTGTWIKPVAIWGGVMCTLSLSLPFWP